MDAKKLSSPSNLEKSKLLNIYDFKNYQKRNELDKKTRNAMRFPHIYMEKRIYSDILSSASRSHSSLQLGQESMSDIPTEPNNLRLVA